jgi:hypothetical protein
MADEIKEVVETQPEKKQEEHIDSQPKTILGGKYKSVEELEKAYKEAEETLGKQGEELRQSREFATVVQPVLEAVRDDPSIFSLVDTKLRGNQNQSMQNNIQPEGKSSEELRNVASDLVTAKFEEKYGIDKLSAEEQRDLRGRIGDMVFRMSGQPMDKVDLRRLPDLLDNAYVLANKDKLIEKSKLEALVGARSVNEAAIGSLSSSSDNNEISLSPEEARVATKMGLTREQYLDGKKKSGR